MEKEEGSGQPGKEAKELERQSHAQISKIDMLQGEITQLKDKLTVEREKYLTVEQIKEETEERYNRLSKEIMWIESQRVWELQDRIDILLNNLNQYEKIIEYFRTYYKNDEKIMQLHEKNKQQSIVNLMDFLDHSFEEDQ